MRYGCVKKGTFCFEQNQNSFLDGAFFIYTRRLRPAMTTPAEQMKQRAAAGEFGNPVNLDQYNAAWSAMMEDELGKRGKKPIYHTISGLWEENSNSGKVAHSGRVQEEIVIPAGSKLLTFRKNSDNPNAPALSIVWVSYED